MSPEEDRTCDTVDSEPKHYQLSYSGPGVCVWMCFCVGVWASMRAFTYMYDQACKHVDVCACMYASVREWERERESVCMCMNICLLFRGVTQTGAMYRHGIFPPIGGFPPNERSHGSFLRSVQICWESYRVYLTCERFSESNFANLPRASISFLHGTFSNGVNLFYFGHHQSVHGLAESTTKGSNPIVTCKSAVYGL